MKEVDAYHGIHAAPGFPDLPGFKRVEWFPPEPRTDRIRVRVHTCECAPIVYELCSAAGLFFIRRTDRTTSPTRIAESEWKILPRIEGLWLRILAGQAR